MIAALTAIALAVFGAVVGVLAANTFGSWGRPLARTIVRFLVDPMYFVVGINVRRSSSRVLYPEPGDHSPATPTEAMTFALKEAARLCKHVPVLLICQALLGYTAIAVVFDASAEWSHPGASVLLAPLLLVCALRGAQTRWTPGRRWRAASIGAVAVAAAALTSHIAGPFADSLVDNTTRWIGVSFGDGWALGASWTVIIVSGLVIGRGLRLLLADAWHSIGLWMLAVGEDFSETRADVARLRRWYRDGTDAQRRRVELTLLGLVVALAPLAVAWRLGAITLPTGPSDGELAAMPWGQQLLTIELMLIFVGSTFREMLPMSFLGVMRLANVNVGVSFRDHVEIRRAQHRAARGAVRQPGLTLRDALGFLATRFTTRSNIPD